ncbi:MAG TPA: hypothetical protein VEI97_18060, partial [bacterium]|nr:hypothetical protein [bacterium]
MGYLIGLDNDYLGGNHHQFVRFIYTDGMQPVAMVVYRPGFDRGSGQAHPTYKDSLGNEFERGA